ncbi:MAG TPA: hypothetical protein VLD67_00935 [Vicinamibacterales bacterium]|nr:hypothetical protein [Vicinamibacterales bacterium]
MQGDALGRIDLALQRIARLAEHLPDGDTEEHVRRSVSELRAAFDGRAPMEPAVARVVRSLQLLTGANHGGRRRVFDDRAPGIDRMDAALESELLPELRRMGFDV